MILKEETYHITEGRDEGEIRSILRQFFFLDCASDCDEETEVRNLQI